jgi:DNA-binding NtrC family response regulator
MLDNKSYLTGKKLLAVDEEEDVLEIIKEELDMADIDTAKDYETASAKISRNIYDLAILDIMGVDGLTLLEEAVGKKIPTVMLTAHSMDYKTLLLSFRKGSIGFLPKEKLSELDRLLDMLISAYNDKIPTWKVLFDELGEYFTSKFGKQMETVDWINRDINK